MHRLNTTLSLPANSLPQVSACGSNIANANSSEDHNILSVSGIRIDTVDGVFPGSSGMLFNLRNTRQAHSNPSAYGADRETFNALWSALSQDWNYIALGLGIIELQTALGSCLQSSVALLRRNTSNYVDKDKRSHSVSERLETSEPSFARGDSVWDFNKWYKYNREAIFAGRTIKAWAELYNPLYDELGRGVAPNASTTWKYFCNGWGPVDLGRRVITTTKGFVGTALEQSCGDVVCVILGFKLPVILRPCNISQQFEVIGESYIHGLMDGEAMEDLKSGKYQLETFKLC